MDEAGHERRRLAERRARRRQRRAVEETIALLERGAADPRDPELAAALVRLGEAIAAWFARHGEARPWPPATG